MTYVDAYHDREQDVIQLVGRDKDGRRFYNTLNPDYSFYYYDINGNDRSIFGDPVSKVTVNTWKAFQKEQKILAGRKLFENDIRPVFKSLEQHYLNAELPILHTAPIDIETGFCQERGFSTPDDPHQPITAITVNFDWEDKLITIALKPKGMAVSEGEKISEHFENCFVFEDEGDLLRTFYDLIEDVDVLYTWNGETFDIPYIVNRTIKVLGKEYTRKLCLWNMLPKKRTFERYGKEQTAYDLFGRVHLDYLQLYRKYTYHEQPSYRLDFIGEQELGETKTPYEGTLDNLYNNDFQKFIEYNRQDVKLLYKFENKLKFIALTNVLAHENCVLLPTTLGPVALTDQAVILEAHQRGMVAPERQDVESNGKIAGGFVADPKTGLTEWVASVDINSLYPTAIRILNMSPETLIGQIRQELTEKRYAEIKKDLLAPGVEVDEEDDEESEGPNRWDGLFSCLEYDEVMNQSDIKLTVDLTGEDQPITMTAKEIYEWIFNPENHVCISANGTIFRTDIDGIIPGLLEKWYADRKDMQKKAKEFEKLANEHHGDKEKYKEYKYWRDYWDQRQTARKINLNAAYGAITNAGSKFCDHRIGQSTTLSGRVIMRHMNAKVNELLTGTYDYKGQASIYADTDSCYFTVSAIKEDLESQGFTINRTTFVDLADSISDQVNDSFSEFVTKAFNIMPDRRELIKCAREICAERALFIKKKRYAILYYDKDGMRRDLNGKYGELKIMGLDTQRADTPKTIQDFLKEVLFRVLKGDGENQVIDYIREFRTKLKALDPWEKGTPKRVNNLTSYFDKMNAKSNVTLPGHVRASINWNAMRKMHNDNYALQIMDGQKVIVCKLKQNPLGYTSIAYPIDEMTLPRWFKELPFDSIHMEERLIDQKLNNIIGILSWNLDATKVNASFSKLFEFE